ILALEVDGALEDGARFLDEELQVLLAGVLHLVQRGDAVFVACQVHGVSLALSKPSISVAQQRAADRYRLYTPGAWLAGVDGPAGALPLRCRTQRREIKLRHPHHGLH